MFTRPFWPWLVAVAVALFGLLLGLKSVIGFAHADWAESDYGLDKFSTAPIHELIERGALDRGKVLDAAGATVPPEGLSDSEIRRRINRYLFADDVRLAVRGERGQARLDAITCVVLLFASTTVIALRRPPRTASAA